MWNHRVVRTKDLPNEGYYYSYDIYEVYYDEDGSVSGLTMNATTPYGESLKELTTELGRFSGALEKPILELVDGKYVEVL